MAQPITTLSIDLGDNLGIERSIIEAEVGEAELHACHTRRRRKGRQGTQLTGLS